MQRKTAKRFVSGLLAATLLMWGMPVLAQGDEGTEPPPADPQVAPTGITVQFSRMSDLVLDVGDTDDLLASVTLTYGEGKPETPPEVQVEWTTAPTDSTMDENYKPITLTPQKPTENSNGLGLDCTANVKADQPGGVEVTVTASVTGVDGKEIKDTATRTVKVSGLVLTGPDGKVCSELEPLEILQGEQKQLTCHAYGKAEGVSPVWLSESNSVAYVVQGMVTSQTIGETKITASVNDYVATCTVEVVENTNLVIDYDNYNKREPLSMKMLVEKLKTNCLTNLGESLQYVRSLAVSPKQGVLYYHYVSSGNTGSGVGATEVYYINPTDSGRRDFSDITFVPNPEFAGKAEISFTAYGTSGNSYTGTIRISVGGQADVAYSTAGDPVHFEVDDFAAIYRQVTAGSSLRSVRFQLPDPVQGTLYYDYDVTDVYIQRVEAGKDYYRDSNPRLDLVSFLPSPGYTGTVSIPYTAVGGGGLDPYNGTLTITVEDSGEEFDTLQDIQYTSGTSGVSMDGNDFADACSAATGQELNYVFLTSLPQSGKLYLNYGGSNQKELTASDLNKTALFVKKVLDSDQLLSDLTYVPTGTEQVTDSFTYTGVDKEGGVVKGTVKIEANVPGSSSIRYSGTSLPVRFRGSDFSNACQTILKSDLAYITFLSLPDSSVGHLYLGYETITDKGAMVDTKTQCVITGDNAKSLVYVPRAGYTGRVSFTYMGYDAAGKNFTGSVTVSLGDNYWAPHFTDMGGYSWAQPAVEFLYSAGIVSGVGNNRYNPGSPITRGDFAIMLCRTFQLTNNGPSTFTDVPADAYYAWAVAAAQQNGVVMGDGTGRFHPNSSLTRQDAMVMLYQAMLAGGMEVPQGDLSVLNKFTDRASIADYAMQRVASLVQMGVVSGDTNHRLKPQQAISRAEMAAILHSALTV